MARYKVPVMLIGTAYVGCVSSPEEALEKALQHIGSQAFPVYDLKMQPDGLPLNDSGSVYLGNRLDLHGRLDDVEFEEG